MTTPQRVLANAASRIGYYAPADPLPGSEAGRYVADLWASFPNAQAAHDAGCANWEGNAGWLRGSSSSIWWCCLFVSMCYWEAGGRNMPGIPNYNCDNLKSKARAYVLSNKRNAQPGDFVLYDWGGDGSCDHIGIVELNCGNYIQTIEGNTSGSAGGRQSNGNGVWRRTRNWGTVNCIIRPIYVDDPVPPPPPPKVYPETELEMPISSNTMYRLRNPFTDKHHYTSNANERQSLISQGWQDEGVAWKMPANPVLYRLYLGDDHFITPDYNEAHTLVDQGWKYEGIEGDANPAGVGVPVRRLHNPFTHDHIYTIDENEMNFLISQGWEDEGTKFYAE